MDPTPFAEPLANISGDHVAPGLIPTLMSNHDSQGLLSRFFWSTGIREKTGEILTEVALGALDVVADLLAGFTLVGSAIMILLKIGGWRDGGRWAGVLVVANILLRALLNNGGA
ncbi:hypothetical protein [Cytobacillus gottheilii]|uniref:hypothetical protein n=1 Tax=Cytobacillus gottheilii TaxID=859144 RepID=UPI001FE73619|nr:hypothetical protein [Cytobacillus gottheilii]